MFRELDHAYLRARDAFLPFDEVVGVGYGPKLKDGKVVARQAIIVFVDRKLPTSEVPRGHLIPPVFEGLPTDVRVPQLVPNAHDRGDKGGKGLPEDFCLTDYQWIDWPKIHRRRMAQR